MLGSLQSVALTASETVMPSVTLEVGFIVHILRDDDESARIAPVGCADRIRDGDALCALEVGFIVHILNDYGTGIGESA